MRLSATHGLEDKRGTPDRWAKDLGTLAESEGQKRRLIFLGTGTSHGVPMIGCHCPVCRSDDPRNKRTRCAAVVQLPAGNLLIDTPPELRLQLIREKIDCIHTLLFTHHHADHMFGLDDVRIFPKYLSGPLPVYCERPVERTIRTAFAYAFDPATELFPAGGIPKLKLHRINRAPFEVLGQRVVPIRLMHGRFRVLGFRFDNLAYCTDVNEIPARSWKRLEGLDVLILDALRENPHPTHFSLSESLAVIEKLRPRQAYLTHMAHNLDHEATNARLPDHVRLAYDGLAIEF